MNLIYLRRKIINYTALGLSLSAMLFGLFWLVWILWTLGKEGLSAMNWQIFTEMTPAPFPGSTGGLKNAIVGSLLMAGVGTLIGTPIGILAGVYLGEYGQRGWLAPITRFINDILLSAPSIIIGMFVYQLVIAENHIGHVSWRVFHGYAGWAGSFALALLVIPVVVRTTDNMLKLVPNSLREAAAALGTPQWKIISFISLRAARAGILTGILLAVARIAGETAPLIFTALNNQFWSLDMTKEMANLPMSIMNYYRSGMDEFVPLAWVASLLITGSVLLLNILGRVIFRQEKIS